MFIYNCSEKKKWKASTHSTSVNIVQKQDLKIFWYFEQVLYHHFFSASFDFSEKFMEMYTKKQTIELGFKFTAFLN